MNTLEREELEERRRREERRALLREAFPVDDFRGALCALCRSPRRSHHALCSWCWSSLAPSARRRLLRMPLEERALSIVAMTRRARAGA